VSAVSWLRGAAHSRKPYHLRANSEFALPDNLRSLEAENISQLDDHEQESFPLAAAAGW